MGPKVLISCGTRQGPRVFFVRAPHGRETFNVDETFGPIGPSDGQSNRLSSLGYQIACASPRTAINTNTAPHKPCSPHCSVIGCSRNR